jgi:lactoylglutathione lyase
MRLDHVAIWARDLECLKDFYCGMFGATAGKKYVNPAKGFESYFLTFPGGGKLEVMRKPGLADAPVERFGQAHFAVSLGSSLAVDDAAGRLREAGVRIVDGPRRTGDGFYECAVEDPEGNRVELVA